MKKLESFKMIFQVSVLNRPIQRILFLFLFVLLGHFYSIAQTNVGLNKPAHQSSIYSNSEKYGPSFANDGKIEEQNKGGADIMCTQKEANPWWEVDLLNTYTINEIRLHNRINGDPDRLANFTILVSDTPFTGNNGGTVFVQKEPAPSGENGFGSYSGNATGRYVRLFLEGFNYMSVPEIEIYGSLSGGAKWDFYNDGNFPIIVKVDNVERGTLSVSNKVQTLPISIGEEITFSVIEEDQKDNRHKMGHSPILITNRTQNPLRIKPIIAFDPLSEAQKSYDKNNYGIDLTVFNPLKVNESFTTSTEGRIFEGLIEDTYDYETIGKVHQPLGFKYETLRTGDGSFSSKTIVGKTSMKEAWSIGATAEVPIPLPPTVAPPGTTVTPSLGFKYGESNVETTSESDIFIASNERKRKYNLRITDLRNVVLNKIFIREIEKMNTAEEAKAIVARYGTHYTDNVIYGGQFQSYVQISENTYFKSKEQNVSLDLGVEVATGAAQGGESPPSGKGELGFTWQKGSTEENLFKDIKSEYWYVGGKGNEKGWDVEDGKEVAISVGELFYISDLVRPEIFKTAMKESEFTKKRILLKEAIEERLKNMKYLEQRAPTRTIKYRIKSMKYTECVDDANTKVKGNITAKIFTVGESTKLLEEETMWKKENWSEENKGSLTDRQELKLKPNDWHEIKQTGTYARSEISGIQKFDPNVIKFDPLMIMLDGSITDQDHAGDNDTMTLFPMPTVIGENSERQVIILPLNHFKNHAEKMSIEVTLEVVPFIGF